jgi:hypothetical protein
LACCILVLALFSAYKEKKAPKSATIEMMVAASRYGEGIWFVVMNIAKAISSSNPVDNKNKRIRRGTALFMSVIIMVGFVFCLKDFLSRFLDQTRLLNIQTLTMIALYICKALKL